MVQRLVDPALDALGDLGVVAGREPPAQPELVNLIGVEMLLEPEHVGEVVRRYLDGRLSDLECRFGRRALALLGNEDARLRSCVLELQPQAKPGEAAPENCDVVAFSRLLVGHLALLFPSSEIRLIAFGRGVGRAGRFALNHNLLPLVPRENWWTGWLRAFPAETCAWRLKGTPAAYAEYLNPADNPLVAVLR